MSDLDKLIAVLVDFGVGFEQTFEPARPHIGRGSSITITCEDGMAKVNSGYGGFGTSFHFTEDGKFISMGAWE